MREKKSFFSISGVEMKKEGKEKVRAQKE